MLNIKFFISIKWFQLASQCKRSHVMTLICFLTKNCSKIQYTTYDIEIISSQIRSLYLPKVLFPMVFDMLCPNNRHWLTEWLYVCVFASLCIFACVIYPYYKFHTAQFDSVICHQQFLSINQSCTTTHITSPVKKQQCSNSSSSSTSHSCSTIVFLFLSFFTSSAQHRRALNSFFYYI